LRISGREALVGIVRVVEWKLTCSVREADGRLRQAFATIDLTPVGSPGSVNGTPNGRS
jgi:hypothetical protein